MSTFSIQWDQLGAGVAAVGSLGLAAFGVTEALGKAFALTYRIRRGPVLHHFGLPYIGLGAIRRMAHPLRPALECAYGAEFAEIIAAQYRAGRSQGSAPDTIRQGVRLGLPFLSSTAATKLIAAIWHMDAKHSQALALAMQAPSAGRTPTATDAATPQLSDQDAAALAGRFATALDARINAAFQLADERYDSVARTLAGVVSLILAIVFKLSMPPTTSLSWPLVIAIGLVAVPLAPVAKDLSSSLQNALTAFKSISGKAP
jgi:hypothetical protein